MRYLVLMALLLALHPTLVLAGTTGGDFALRNPSGEVVTLSSLRGKVVLLYFGFTSCPEMCPTKLLEFQQLLNRLPAHLRQRVQPVFISVDPARDSPEVLGPYVTHFGEGILALTGTEEQLRAVAARYGAQFRYVHTGSSYTVDHSVNTYLIDPQGRLVRAFLHGTPVEEQLRHILSLLAN